jgi:hypothetical protein
VAPYPAIMMLSRNEGYSHELQVHMPVAGSESLASQRASAWLAPLAPKVAAQHFLPMLGCVCSVDGGLERSVVRRCMQCEGLAGTQAHASTPITVHWHRSGPGARRVVSEEPGDADWLRVGGRADVSCDEVAL